MENGVGIICECNPFHNGHRALFRAVREAFPAKPIVCVMSSDFVQRAEAASLGKYARAETALLAGADLVLELPFPFSALSAEGFAAAGVFILSQTGLCSHLAFGCESGTAEEFDKVAGNLLSEKMAAKLLQDGAKKEGYPAFRERCYGELFGGSALFSGKNSALALEYVLAMRRQNAALSLFPVRRTEGEGILSATALREAAKNKGASALAPFVPPETLPVFLREEKRGHFPVSTEALSAPLLYALRTSSASSLKKVYAMAGLEARAKLAAAKNGSFSEIAARMKNPRYTDSRIRRALLSLLCGIPRGVERETPAYTVLLGANARGRALLAEKKEESRIPVFTRPAEAQNRRDLKIAQQASCAFVADAVYQLCLPDGEEGALLRQRPVILP